MEGILNSDGKSIENVNDIHTIIGYQAEHNVTGRLLPMCNRFEVYELFTLMKKMSEVAEHMDECLIEFNIWDYNANPIYDVEVEGNSYVIINEHLV